MIRAITFDFWDTLAADDSDEPKRRAHGLKSKLQTRLDLLDREITTFYPEISSDLVRRAFEKANNRFDLFWKRDARTLSVWDRYGLVFSHLGLAPTSGFEKMVQEIEEMELKIPPDPVPGLQNTLEMLSRRFPLGIISDTIHTPGAGLRSLLETWGVKKYFQRMIFSDEVAVSKPSAKVFEFAASGLGCAPWELLHVGDREDKDVRGAKAVHAKAVLLTELKDRRLPNVPTQADWVCEKFVQLAEVRL